MSQVSCIYASQSVSGCNGRCYCLQWSAESLHGLEPKTCFPQHFERKPETLLAVSMVAVPEPSCSRCACPEYLISLVVMLCHVIEATFGIGPGFVQSDYKNWQQAVHAHSAAKIIMHIKL